MFSRKTGQRSGQEEQSGSLRCCTLCCHSCRIKPGKKGLCNVRINDGQKIKSLVYGRVIAENIDPIEKKPLFHIYPGSLSYSVATPGCNFTCLHCQNASISQVPPNYNVENSGRKRQPAEIAAAAAQGGCRTISYTYVEPTVFFEFAADCCLAAKERGIGNIFVSNGYMSESTIKELAPLLVGINIDLKSFQDSFYKDVCGARLKPVLNAIARFREEGVWVEVTTLIIPTLNDSEKELAEIASFLVSVDENIPWHVTAFYPTHKMTRPNPTPPLTLHKARDIGLTRGLHHVYTGNLPGSGGENSVCHNCKTTVISRHGFQVTSNRLVAGTCPECQTEFAGVFT